MTTEEEKKYKKIQITPRIRINNPCNKASIYKYEGELEGFSEWTRQQKMNYEKLQESFNPFDIKLDYIWAGIFGRTYYYRSKITPVLHFVAKSTDARIYWQKFESQSSSSGQNHLYIDGQKMKLTEWLKMTEDEHRIILEPNDEDEPQSDKDENNKRI